MARQHSGFTLELDHEVRIATLLEPRLFRSEEIELIGMRLFELVDSGVDRLILDFSNIDFLSSAFLGRLIALQRRLDARNPSHAPRRYVLEVCRDRKEAKQVIGQPDSSPMVLCSVGPNIMEVFRIVRLCR